jgi:hypothetical protein
MFTNMKEADMKTVRNEAEKIIWFPEDWEERDDIEER